LPVPSPPVVDAFTYADNPLDTANGANWHNLSSSPMAVFSDTVGPTSGVASFNQNYHEMFRPTLRTDCEAAITLTTPHTNTWVYVRLQNGDDSTGWSQPPLGYYTRYDHAASLVYLNYGAGIASTTVALTGGDKICCRAYGYQIQAWVYTSGAWHNVLSANDGSSTYSSGRAGISQGKTIGEDSIGRLDDFAFGPYPSSSTTGTGSPAGFYPVFQTRVYPKSQ
jgi:hypothetical protein